MRQIIAVLLSLIMVLVVSPEAEAKYFIDIIINETNQNAFWTTQTTKNKPLGCYKKEGKFFPGKIASGKSGGIDVDFWKDVYRKKISKLKKAKKNTKTAKKTFQALKKICKNSEPPPTPPPTPTPTPTPTPIPEPMIECGNGILEGAEVCDDSNIVSGDGCSATCTNEKCGDGVVQSALGEECDDSNVVPGDGCSALCSVEGPVLIPSTGFSGATSEPGPVGDPAAPAFTAKAIARWNVVPFETFHSEMNVGVVAFHIAGISRVEFSVNGGAWESVETMSMNQDSGTAEYWVKLKGVNFSDGPLEVRAIAFPSVGQPRLLEPLFLNSNYNSSLPHEVRYVSAASGNDTTGDGSIVYPFATLAKALKDIAVAVPGTKSDGGRVYLLSGNYNLGEVSPTLESVTLDRWVTIRPAPGVARNQVTISTSDISGLKNKLVKLESLTITTELKSDTALEDYLWIKDCVLQGLGRDTVISENGFVGPGSGWSSFYITDSVVQDHKNGIPADLVRNVELNSIGSDVFSGAKLVINSEVNVVNSSGTMYEPDLFEFDFVQGDIENRIYYGITAYDTGADGFKAIGSGVRTLKDVAFVNVLHDYAPYEGIATGLFGDVLLNHILFWHVTTTQDITWATVDSSLTNISIRNSVFLGFQAAAPATTVILNSHDVEENHFISDGDLYFIPGIGSTTGPAGFANQDLNNFTPGPSSPLKDRALFAPVLFDVGGNLRAGEVSLGAFE